MKIRRAVPLEIQECFVFAHWLFLKKIPFYPIYVPGKLSPAEAGKLQRLGVGQGYPDYAVPLSRKGYHGLFIEMKRRKRGVVSTEQQEKINALNAEGYLAVVCYGADEAIKAVEDYVAC